MDTEINCVLVRVSVPIDRLCLKDDMEEEPVLADKTETGLKVDLKMRGCKNDMEKLLYWTYKETRCSFNN